MNGGGLEMQALADRAARVRASVPISKIIGGGANSVKLRAIGREKTGLCPFHNEKRDGTFMVNDDKGIFKCFGCGAGGDVIEYLVRRNGVTFMQALKDLESDAGIDHRSPVQNAEFDRLAERAKREREDAVARGQRDARNFWLTSALGEGTPAQRYLEGRGIDFAKLGKFPGAIRFRADAWNEETGKKMPAMAACVVLGSAIIAAHRTFLTFGPKGWVKADVEKPKKVLGSFLGGHIPLWKGMHDVPLARLPAGAMVAASEGIEDALSVAMADPEQRIVAGISLDNLGNLALPAQAGDLILLCQRDQEDRLRREAAALAAGDPEAAAYHAKCARDIEAALERAIGKQQAMARSDGSGRAVRCAWPNEGFKDFNDELRGMRMEGA
jgi:hypothetical protein